MVAPSLDVSWVSENAELIERATAVDEAASALKSSLEVNFCTSSTGDEGLVADNLGLWKRGIVRRVDGRFNLTVGLSTARKIGNVTTAPGIALGRGSIAHPCHGLESQSLEKPFAPPVSGLVCETRSYTAVDEMGYM